MSNITELLEQLLEAEPIFKVTVDILDPKMYLKISTPPGYGDFHKDASGITTFKGGVTLLSTNYSIHIHIAPKSSESAQLEFKALAAIPHAKGGVAAWSLHMENDLADSVVEDLVDKFHGKEQFTISGDNLSAGSPGASAFLSFSFTKKLIIQHGGTPLDIQKAIYTVDHEFQGLLKELIVEAQRLLVDNTTVETAAELSAEKAGFVFIQMATLLADLSEKLNGLVNIKVPEDPKVFFQELLNGDASVVKALQSFGDLSWIENMAVHAGNLANEFHNDLNTMHDKLRKLGAD